MKAKFTLKIMIIPVILLFASVSAYADPKTSCRKENGSNIVKTSISKNDEFIQVSDGDNFYFVVSGNYKSNMDRSLTRNYLMKYSFKKNKMYSVRFPDILDFDSKKLICQDERNLFIRGEKGLYIADKSNFQIVGCIKEIDNKPVKVFSYGSRIYSASYLNVLLDDVRNESYLYYYKALNNKPSSGMLIWHKPGYGEEKVKGKVSVWRVKDRKKIFTYVTENYNSQPAVYDRRLYYCSSDTNAIRIRSVANTENNERVISLKNRAGIIKVTAKQIISVLISAVECLDLRSGLQCWYFSEQDLIKLEVFRKNNGLILFRNFSVVCIDEKSGGLKWTFEPPGVDADSGLIQHGFSLTEDEFSQSVSKYIIVSADYYKIKNNEEVWKLTRYYILDPQNGKQIKHVDTVSISSSLQYVNGKLVLSCMNLEKSLLHLSYPK